jgi:hypothetical protein
VIDLALNGPDGSPKWRAESETLWNLINGIFTAGEDTLRPSHDGNTSPDELRPHPRF